MPPANDTYPYNLGSTPDFEDTAYYIAGTSGFAVYVKSGGCFAGTTLGATAQAGEPNPAPGFPATHSVWVTWEANFTGTVRAWLTSTDVNMADGIMSVYNWTYLQVVNSLPAPIAQGDDELGTQPQIDFAVISGNRYVFQIDTRDSGGAFTFHWKRSDGTPPANDDFANAQLITGIGGEVTGTFATATAECNEPSRLAESPGVSGPYNTVWYKWVAPVNGKGIIQLVDYTGTRIYQTTNRNGKPFIDIFQGATLAGLTNVPSAASSGLEPSSPSRTFTMVAGQTYYIRLDSEEDLSAPTFTLVWETNTLDWRAKAITFTAGATSISTGLGKLPKAIMISTAGIPNNAHSVESIHGWGASDGSAQWGSGFAHPRLVTADVVVGGEYAHTRFSTSKIISIPNASGGIYAEATLTGVDADGTVHLSWSTNPGDGALFGCIVISGIQTAVGTMSFADYVTATASLVPGFRTRALFAAQIGDSTLRSIPPDNAGASEWAVLGWTESMPLSSDYTIGVGAKLGISWYGANNDDGDFLVGQSDVRFRVTTSGTAYSGARNFTVEKNDANGTVQFGWIALGGYGFHSITDAPAGPSNVLDANFWVQMGLSFGANGFGGGDLSGAYEIGAFDRSNSQFVFTQWYQQEFDIHDVHTNVSRTAHNDRVADGLHDLTENDKWVITLPSGGALGGYMTPTDLGLGISGVSLANLGNFFTPVPVVTIIPIVSFSSIRQEELRTVN